MQEIIFKPKYPLRLYLVWILLVPLEAFALWSVYSTQGQSIEAIIAAGFFGLMVVISPLIFTRRIKFDSQSLIIEKYILPPKTINYSEITDIANIGIKTRQGNIGTKLMENSEELYGLLQKLINEGKINRYQIENKLTGEEIVSRKAIRPATIISIVLWVVFLQIFPSEKSMLRELSFLLVWTPIYLMVYMFMKNRADTQ